MKLTQTTCVLLILAILICSKGVAAQDTATMNPRVILEKENVEYAYPHFSNDATKILFQSNESGNWRICTADVSGSNVTELTTDTSNCYFPDWSPDNKLICFVSSRTGNEEIYLMRADGSDLKQLTSNGARNIHPYFSPDGRKILFSSTVNSPDQLDVYEMTPEGKDVKRITNTADNETCARMSPSETEVVYLKNNGKGLDDIFLLSLKDSVETNITNDNAWNGWPSWSPDGKLVLFSGVRDSVYKMYSLNTVAGVTTMLTNPPAHYFDCRANMSPDGKSVIFNRQHDTDEGRTNAIYILDL